MWLTTKSFVFICWLRLRWKINDRITDLVMIVIIIIFERCATLSFLPSKTIAINNKLSKILHYSNLLRMSNTLVKFKDSLRRATQFIQPLSTFLSCTKKLIINLFHKRRVSSLGELLSYIAVTFFKIIFCPK